MPCHHQGHCSDFEFSNFPYDKHKCEFMFGSWMKSGEELNFEQSRVKITSKNAKSNKNWKLYNASIEYNKGVYDSVPNETYPTLDLTFWLERHNELYVSGISAPSIILMLANIAVFYFQAKSARRLFLCILIICSHELYLEYLYWM